MMFLYLIFTSLVGASVAQSLAGGLKGTGKRKSEKVSKTSEAGA